MEKTTIAGVKVSRIGLGTWAIGGLDWGAIPDEVAINTCLGAGRSATIRVDNFAGGGAVARHLAEIGCRRIAHIQGPAANLEAQDRMRGFMAAAAELLPQEEFRTRVGDFTERSGYEAMRQLLQAPDRPDGVFVANDMMAMGALYAIKEAGLSIPTDIAVVGFDDLPHDEQAQACAAVVRADHC